MKRKPCKRMRFEILSSYGENTTYDLVCTDGIVNVISDVVMETIDTDSVIEKSEKRWNFIHIRSEHSGEFFKLPSGADTTTGDHDTKSSNEPTNIMKEEAPDVLTRYKDTIIMIREILRIIIDIIMIILKLL